MYRHYIFLDILNFKITIFTVLRCLQNDVNVNVWYKLYNN